MKHTAEVIDRSYDVRPAYRLGAWCSNCGWEGEVRREMGVEPPSRLECPRCGCGTARARTGDFKGVDRG